MKFILALWAFVEAKKNKNSLSFSGAESAVQLESILSELNPLRQRLKEKS